MWRHTFWLAVYCCYFWFFSFYATSTVSLTLSHLNVLCSFWTNVWKNKFTSSECRQDHPITHVRKVSLTPHRRNACFCQCSMTLTFGLWPWKPFQQCPLTWFLCAVSLESLHWREKNRVTRINGQRPDGRHCSRMDNTVEHTTTCTRITSATDYLAEAKIKITHGASRWQVQNWRWRNCTFRCGPLSVGVCFSLEFKASVDQPRNPRLRA